MDTLTIKTKWEYDLVILNYETGTVDYFIVPENYKTEIETYVLDVLGYNDDEVCWMYVPDGIVNRFE